MRYILYGSILISSIYLIINIVKYLQMCHKDRLLTYHMKKYNFIWDLIEKNMLTYVNSYITDPRFPKDVTIQTAHNNTLKLTLGAVSKKDLDYMKSRNPMFENMISLSILECLGEGITAKKYFYRDNGDKPYPTFYVPVDDIDDYDDFETNDE